MIEITVGNNSLKIKGHADFAPLGQDIVCAGISALWQALYFKLREWHLDGAIILHEKILSDEKYVCASVLNSYDLAFKECLDMTVKGMEAIANTYPYHVTIKNAKRVD